MDKSSRKLDKAATGLYIIHVTECLAPKNRLEREVMDYFYRTQHLNLVTTDALRNWYRLQEAQIDKANAKHPRSKPVRLICTQQELFTTFITINIHHVREVISEVTLPDTLSA